MKLNERQQQNKKKSQQQLQAIVDAYHGKTAPTPVPAPKKKAPVKKQVVKKTKPTAKPKKTKEQIAKEQAKAQAREMARLRRGDTAARMRDTIENYRSVPMSKAKRQRRNILFYAVLVAVLVTVFAALSLTVLFHIAEISVEGENYYTEERIIEATGIQLDDNMFRINMKKIEDRLIKELPRIKSINIRRVLMDKIVIDIVEADPVAVVYADNNYLILDADSKVLESTPVLPLDLILLTGAQVSRYEIGSVIEFEDTDIADIIKRTMTALDDAGLLKKSAELNLEKKYNICLRYGEFITCELGDTEKLDKKMQMILKVMEDNPDDVTAVIDASDPNKVYYRPNYE